MLLTLLIGALMCAVIFYDVTRYIIPNWIVGLLLLAYPLALYLTPNPFDWQSSAMMALVAFAVGFVIYALKLMGGGDVKLLVVTLLWFRVEVAFEYLLQVAVVGGALGLVLWLSRMAIAKGLDFSGKKLALPRILQVGAPLPYGVAIAGVFLYRMWTNQMLILPVIHF